MLELNSVWIENDSGEERTILKYLPDDIWGVKGRMFMEPLLAITGYCFNDLDDEAISYNVWHQCFFLNNHTLKESEPINV